MFNGSTAEMMTTVVTTVAPPSVIAPVWGYVSVGVAVIIFGSNLVPVKKFETGDGVFFQWVSCNAIWLAGLVLHAVRGFPEFHALAMLGGFLWCTGNILVVPIIKTIGLGQGILIWASFNLLSGWASARFGWFGIKKEIPPNEALNYSGVSLCLISAFIYMLLKTNTTQQRSYTVTVEVNQPLLNESEADDHEDKVFFERFSRTQQRIMGTVSACIAGLLFGLNFTPVIYLKDNNSHFSQNGLDYVFSHFCGVLVTSTFFTAVYCVVMCNKPRVYPKVILPGLVSGTMWAIADIGWFIANDALSEPISFPIITAGPSMIGALWGIGFGEIRGKRNYVVLVVAFALAITGSILTGLSKIGHSDLHPTNSTTTHTPHDAILNF